MKLNSNSSIKVPAKAIIPVVTFIVGLVFFWVGLTKFGFWNKEALKPTEGFFPIIIAAALMALSVLAFLQSLKGDKNIELRLINWYVPLGLIAMILLCLVIGTVPSVILFMLFWLKVYEKQSWKCTITVLIIVLLIVVGCFIMWLDIDFPMGIIYDSFFG